MSDPTPKTAREPSKDAGNELTGAAIRQFRKDVGLTQVEFARELGVTPTTIYRYEAATNSPTNDILAKILQFAVKKQSLTAVQDLAEILGLRTGLKMLFRDDPDNDSPLLQAIAGLDLEHRMLILAAILMLNEGSDQTAVRVLESLLGPWVTKARESFGVMDVALNADRTQKDEEPPRSMRTKEK